MSVMGSQQENASKKRKHSTLDVAELEAKIADLRRKEAIVARHLARLGHQAAPPATATSQPVAPRLHPYEARVKQVKESQALRLKNFWKDVRKEIGRLLKMNQVSQWFGVPVRDSAWGQQAANWENYRSKVSHPMDLSTIRDRLGEDDSTNKYDTPDQIAADVRLIVSNCETFNVGDAGAEVRKVSRTLQSTWERRWQPDDLSGLAYRWRELNNLTHQENEVCACLCAHTACHMPCVHVHALCLHSPPCIKPCLSLCSPYICQRVCACAAACKAGRSACK